MGALSEIQTILRSDNLDGSIWGIKPQLEAWVDELSNVKLPVANLGFTYDGIAYGDVRAVAASVDRSGSNEGFKISITTAPSAVSAAGTVIDVASIVGGYGDFPVSDDEFDLDAKVFITNAANTQVATAHKAMAIDAGETAAVIDWAGLTTAVPTGADLAWTTTAVATTAGGIFIVTVEFTGGWD